MVFKRKLYEIFLLARKNKIWPVEVKLNRYLIYTKHVRKDKDIFCLPIYMAAFL